MVLTVPFSFLIGMHYAYIMSLPVRVDSCNWNSTVNTVTSFQCELSSSLLITTQQASISEYGGGHFVNEAYRRTGPL
jgi:hypothetical protein